MSEKSEKARELFMDGYNCSQAVLLAFADDTGLDKKILASLISPFGGGMAGSHKNVCGAASGMLAAMGMLRGYTDPKDKEAKGRFYTLLRPMLDKFKEENGSLICKEIILSYEGTDKKSRCLNCVGCAARLVEENKNKL